MNNPLARAQLLLAQSRHELAEQELRRVLATDPELAAAHSLLALALVGQQKYDEAEQEAGQAILRAPDSDFAHYCQSVVLISRNKFPLAEAAAREALRLAPADPDYHAQLGRVLLSQGKWQQALDTAEVGLQHDADHEGCNELRTMALTQLGRRQEAIGAAEGQLERNPESATAHANKGWSLLHQRKPKEAIVHFREALRLEPDSDFARAGMVEALKARNPVYRVMLAFFLWMSRLGSQARWGIMIGAYVGYRVLRSVAASNPGLAPWIAPLLILYLCFAALTWFASPLFNLLLRLDRDGRYALSRDQRVASNWLGGCLVVALIGAIYYAVTGDFLGVVVAIVTVGLALPLVVIYSCDVGWPRQAMTIYTAVMALLGGGILVGAWLDQPWTGTLTIQFLLAFFASQFVGTYLASVTPTR